MVMIFMLTMYGNIIMKIQFYVFRQFLLLFCFFSSFFSCLVRYVPHQVKTQVHSFSKLWSGSGPSECIDSKEAHFSQRRQLESCGGDEWGFFLFLQISFFPVAGLVSASLLHLLVVNIASAGALIHGVRKVPIFLNSHWFFVLFSVL